MRWGDPDAPGLLLWVIDPCYYETPCACGHWTRAEAGQGAVDPLLGGVELSEWRLVGPGLATLQVLRHPELPLTNNAVERALRVLGNRAPAQSRYPNRHGITRGGLTCQRHRHLPPARTVAVALSPDCHRRPVRRSVPRRLAAVGGMNNYIKR